MAWGETGPAIKTDEWIRNLTRKSWRIMEAFFGCKYLYFNLNDPFSIIFYKYDNIQDFMEIFRF